MATSDADRLRKLLGESIPPGGKDSDTLFTDVDIADLLARTGGVEQALPEAWAMKAAELATLVTTTEGSSTRHLSDAYKAAADMAKKLGWGGSSIGNARIGNITRKTGVRRSTAG